MSNPIKKAFVLAAGLGTRLRPLTDQLPKPLIPVGHKPLITFAFDHLIADAGIEEFIVNTHHLPEAFPAAFPEGIYRSRPVTFRREPVLLRWALRQCNGNLREALAGLFEAIPAAARSYCV